MQHRVGKRPIENFLQPLPYFPSNFQWNVKLKNIERYIAFEANSELFHPVLKSF